ncbi:MAG: hypothetical protein C0483_20420 [Pirellula sp.]|nr:hypothetical protein [Pirellula sp.]
MRFKPDIIAEVQLLSTAEGGRQGPTPADAFGCLIKLDQQFFDLRIDLTDIGSLTPSMSRIVPIAFLSPDIVKPLIHVGSELTFWDGRTIGHGKVLEILNA